MDSEMDIWEFERRRREYDRQQQRVLRTPNLSLFAWLRRLLRFW